MERQDRKQLRKDHRALRAFMQEMDVSMDHSATWKIPLEETKNNPAWWIVMINDSIAMAINDFVTTQLDDNERLILYVVDAMYSAHSPRTARIMAHEFMAEFIE